MLNCLFIYLKKQIKTPLPFKFYSIWSQEYWRSQLLMFCWSCRNGEDVCIIQLGSLSKSLFNSCGHCTQQRPLLSLFLNSAHALYEIISFVPQFAIAALCHNLLMLQTMLVQSSLIRKGNEKVEKISYFNSILITRT